MEIKKENSMHAEAKGLWKKRKRSILECTI